MCANHRLRLELETQHSNVRYFTYIYIISLFLFFNCSYSFDSLYMRFLPVHYSGLIQPVTRIKPDLNRKPSPASVTNKLNLIIEQWRSFISSQSMTLGHLAQSWSNPWPWSGSGSTPGHGSWRGTQAGCRRPS